MRRRGYVCAFLVLAAVAALSLGTCSGEDVPTTTRRPVSEEPEAVERRASASRQRAQRLAAPADRASPAEADREVVPGHSGNREVRAAGWVTEWVSEPRVAATVVPAAPPATGRVRVLMLKDGRPFEGGHVCFFPEATFVEPGPWDGASSSDYAYAGLPKYTSMWPHFDPVLGSGAPVPGFEEVRGITDAEGFVTLDVPAGRPLVVFVRYAMSGIPLVSQPRVSLGVGEETSVTIEAARARTVKGRCLGADGKPLAKILVQVIHPREERPLSRTVETSAEGAFELTVFGDDPDVRIRAVVPYVTHSLGIHDSEAEVPPIPAETTVAGVVPGEGAVDVWMPNAPLVFIEVTVAEGEGPLGNLQIEGLVWDPVSSAWGRLGGPKYQRAPGSTGSRRSVIALPRAEAGRPLMLWSWGYAITAVDPRGPERLSAEMPRGRWAGVRGRGWDERDRLRVVAFCGPAGRELPCIWIDGVLGRTDHWSRDDSPVSAIEFQILRDGVVVGRSARVPPGTERAAEVRIDLE